MEHRVTYFDAFGVKRTHIWEDYNPDTLHIYTEVDMTNTLEINRELRELHPRRSTNKLLARGVPVTIAEKAMREQWDEKDWAKWLDDADNAVFRVWQGRVGR